MKSKRLASVNILLAAAGGAAPGPVVGEEKSVRPGINEAFENPDVDKFIETFEGESREISVERKKILAACEIRAGMLVSDIGAGTGLFTRLFAEAVGPNGRVYAVDLAPKFTKHIEKTCKERGITNVVGVLCKPHSVELPPESIDLAFIADTYHHFEYPFKSMRTIHGALRPGGSSGFGGFQENQRRKFGLGDGSCPCGRGDSHKGNRVGWFFRRP
jgi:SAM-dependent methyltransferase